jgi:hypothetical protein
MAQHDWDAEAAAMAQFVAENVSHIRRGVMLGRQSRVSVVLGNDPKLDPPAVQDEVSAIAAALEQAGIRILGFGVDPAQSHAWAMIVESEDLALLDDLLSAV